MRFAWIASAAFLLPLAVGCPKTDAGTNAGEGRCELMLQAASAFEPLRAEDEPPVCGGSREARKNAASIDDMENCVCDRSEELAGKLIDPGAQLRHLQERNGGKELIPGCKQNSAEDFFLADAVGCYQLGYVNGFTKRSMQGLGGNGHDGDEHVTLCPFGPEDQGVHNGRDPVRFANREIDLRSGDFLEAEFQWCRWFGGPITAFEDPLHDPPLASVRWDEFRPQKGERVSLVGDWVIDQGGWTELHEVRLGAVVRPHPGVPDVWHLLTSGIFAERTVQQDFLSIDIPVPRSTDPLKTQLKCDRVATDVSGCFNEGIRSLEVSADSERGVCKVRIERAEGNVGARALSGRYCGDTHRRNDINNAFNGPDVNCPCFSWNGELDEAGGDLHQDMVCANLGFTDFTAIDRCMFDGFYKLPSFMREYPEDISRIAFAGDIRAEWTAAPELRAATVAGGSHLWSCDCACDDPSKPGTAVVARVQGCGPAGGQPGGDAIGPEACARACGGEFCGGDAECRLGQCRALGTGTGNPTLVASAACMSPPPETRVAHAGDYRIDLLSEQSFVEVGEVDGDGDFTPLGRGRVMGGFWTNVVNPAAGRELEFANFELFSEDFLVIKEVGGVELGRVSVQNAQAFTTTRFRAQLGSEAASTNFIVLPGRLELGVRAKVDGSTGGSQFLNEGALTGSFDPATRTFSMDGQGQGSDGKAVRFHLQGQVVNVPPVANPGPDRVVECTSPKGTPVSLDGRASSDPDGQPIAHYQWFEGDVGLGNEVTQSTLATLGRHRYDLHVYDGDWASDRETFSVQVQDTTPPDLDVSVSPVCLWPPNHEFQLFKLGREVAYGLSDVCDAEPQVKIVSVTSDEPVDAPGSGSTGPDVRFGPTTACVRAERSGSGPGRSYTVVLEARDASGNMSRKSVKVVVPHDGGDHPECQQATGLDELSEACEQ
ncbi:PKD domain-containing protein [Archangium gephyra]|nr:PKD domain-containing protein [Archangium gephyra]